MRDIIIIGLVLMGVVASFRYPWVGIMQWTWLSLMNPHRYTFGPAYSAPLAAMTVAAILIGLLVTKDKESPFKGTPVTLLAVLMTWITISWALGIDPSGDYEQWKKVMKIDVLILVGLALLHSKKHIIALAWTATLSLAVLGAKGGIFTILQGGGNRVWGPPGSFIEDNNEFALALIMTIPLLRFLQLQIKNKKGKLLLMGMIVLCAASALGSYSRGALLAVSAMGAMMWWRGKNKLGVGIVMALAVIPLVALMPDAWTARMNTIQEYDDDASALGRFSAWWNAWNLAFHYPSGVGFNAARPELFAQYSPYPEIGTPAAHSIYFQMLGNHGFIGLFIFLSFCLVTFQWAGWLRKHGAARPETMWCSDLGTMCQVSLVGYAVGGAFLSLAYFDLPYNIMVLVVLARVWMTSKAWEREPVEAYTWRSIPGMWAHLPESSIPAALSGKRRPRSAVKV